MKAAVYEGKGKICCEDVPIPEIGSDEVLVRMKACGLCQSDIKKILHGDLDPPRIFGHETAGVIERVGSAVTGWMPGDRVAVMHHIPCFSCAHCLDQNFTLCDVYRQVTTTAGFAPSGGGFAEFVKVPGHIVRHGIVRIPEGVSFEEATFVEPVNCCLKAIRKAAIQAGERAAIIGAGPVGLLFVQLLHWQGAVPLVAEPRADRRAKALELGAALALDPGDDKGQAALLQATDSRGADAVFLCVPVRPAANLALSLVRPGGRVLFFAEFPQKTPIEVDPNWIYRNEVALLGSYSSSYKLQALAAEIVLQRRIQVRPLIAAEFPLERIAEAIDLAVHPPEGMLKIILRP
jgi:L-iditol 2-dehydrogenase